MTIHSENAILYAYRHKATGNIVTALYTAKGPATTEVRASMNCSLGSIFWRDQKDRLKALCVQGDDEGEGVAYNDLDVNDQRKARLEYLKHNFEVVEFDIVERRK